MRQANAPSQRQLRVGELLRHELAALFVRGTIVDPGLESSRVTISEVRMSPDLKIATVYFTALGGTGLDTMLEALERNARRIRGELAGRIKLKFMPELRFRKDTAPEYADRVDRLLKSPEVARDLRRGRDE